MANVRVFGQRRIGVVVELEAGGLRPPPAVNVKSCGSFGMRVLHDHDLARACVLANVQVTVSPGATSMFAAGCRRRRWRRSGPSRSGTVSESE